VAETLNQAEKAVAAGAKEIVLTGVNIGDFGASHGETLLDLAKALDGLDGVERFRISSIEPNLLTDDLIDFVATSRKFQPHFHIPLQSGSDKVLGAMRRRYRTDLYRSRIQHIRQVLPTAGIGVDVIVGFPGESDQDFIDTVEFIKSLSCSYLHVFTYSERPNTTALRIEDIVPVPVRKQRNKILRNLSLKMQRAHYEQGLGRAHQVLVEDASEDGLRMGYTPNYIRVAIPLDQAEGNQVVPVHLERVDPLGWVSGEVQSP
jgi:threonylcarbamoyladenosine tRNA methylthiotransferase MtaB